VAAHPAAAVRTLDGLRAAVAACRLCGDAVTPPGVIWARPHHRALIVGQAPGSREVVRHMPFIGPAGKRLRVWLGPAGVHDEASFHDLFAVAAVTKCYPGRSRSGRGDRVPTPAERELCAPWTERALQLLDPPLVIPVGRLAIDDWIGREPLNQLVGERFECDGRVVIPLPHPSGASAWANGPAHLALVARAVSRIAAELRVISSPARAGARAHAR